LLLLSAFYSVIDVTGCRRWAFFFVVNGMNAITIYFLQRFVDFDGIAEFFLGGIAGRTGLLAALVLPSGAFAVRWLLLWFLYRHKAFFRV